MIINRGMEVLAPTVLSVIPGQEITKIENRLLSGQIHVQTVGYPAAVYRIAALCSLDGWNKMLAAAAEASPVTVSYEGEDLEGIIRDNPTMEEYTKGKPRATRMYKVTFQLILNTV